MKSSFIYLFGGGDICKDREVGLMIMSFSFFFGFPFPSLRKPIMLKLPKLYIWGLSAKGLWDSSPSLGIDR